MPTLMQLAVVEYGFNSAGAKKLNGALFINLIVTLSYFLGTGKHSVSHVYEVMSHDNEFLIASLQLIPKAGCYLDEVTALASTSGLFLTLLSSDKSHSRRHLEQKVL